MRPLDSILSFLSVIAIAWMTQRIVSYWDHRKKIAETKLSIYITWLPFFAEMYANARYADVARIDPRDFLKRKMEFFALLQLMGPIGAIDAFGDFCDHAEKAYNKDSSFDAVKLHHAYTELIGQLCCEIHSEKPNPQRVV